MKLLIVSGLSGAGKTVALHSLEDLGAYCIDNLPVNLLPAIAEQTQGLQAYPWVAIGVDARNVTLHDIPALLQKFKQQVPLQVLFLEADDEILIKRYSETRRKHPLSSDEVPLAEAIQRERHLLAPLAEQADTRVDTSRMHLHQLRDFIRVKLQLKNSQSLSVLFQSFGFKHGIPQEADFVFDVRCLPNPHWDPRLRPFSGRDPAVCEFLQNQAEVRAMLEDIRQFITAWLPRFEADNRSYLTVAIGCTGGRHRSVYISEQLAQHFRQRRGGVMLRHRELG